MILVLDDHPVARQGLESIIKMYKPEEQILQAGTVREALKLAETEELDMAFVDINLGKESGFDFLKWMREKGLPTKIFMITSSSDEKDFMYAKEFGVDAYLLKDAFIDDIMYSLKVVERGGKFYSADLIDCIGSVSEEERLLGRLTKREKEVLLLLTQGCSNAKIGHLLFVSEGTVKKHISNILSKLGLQNRVEAVLLAERNHHLLEMEIKLSKCAIVG
ncbi:MAG: response regulator transcription factor [Bacillota bacterium]|nr:response regulator transcription factor [Bacillota bacterium]